MKRLLLVLLVAGLATFASLPVPVEAHKTPCPPIPCQPTGISMSRAWKVYFHTPEGRAGWVTVEGEDYAAAGAQAPSGTIVDDVYHETYTFGEVHWRDTE